MIDYTPTTEEVHAAYLRENDIGHPDDLENAHREFVRWLAGVKADALRHFRQGLIDNQMAHYGIVLPDVGEIVDALDEEADRIEGEA